MTRYPHLLLHFVVNDGDTRHRALRAGQVDFAIIDEEHVTQDMQYTALVPEQYVLVGTHAWKDRTLSDIIEHERIIDYDEADKIGSTYLKKYQLFEYAKHGRYFANRTDNLAYLAAAGVGYTVLAKEFAMPYVQRKQLIILNDNLTLDIVPILAWYERVEPPVYFSDIIHAISGNS